jgi:hypothetical protein
MTAASTTPNGVNLLAYADLPARWGITREQTPTGLWVTVPPLPSWHHLVRSHGWGVGLLVYALILPLFELFDRSRPADPGLLIPVCLYGPLRLLVLWHAWSRLRTRTMLRVTRDVLTIARVSPAGRCNPVTWPKRIVTEIKRNPFSGKLLVRATGREMTEFPLSPNRDITDWVADTVRHGVFEEEFECADVTDRGPLDSLKAAARRTHTRSVLSAIGFCLATVGVALLVVPGLIPFGLGLGLIFIAAVPLGIAMGTQEKKFYT